MQGARRGANRPVRSWQVRFECPPSALAAKPFQNEEVNQCCEYVPGKRYVVETIANTNAPYGDKFNMYFRSHFLAETKATSLLHIVSFVDWHPNMNRLMKPIVSKAVESE